MSQSVVVVVVRRSAARRIIACIEDPIVVKKILIRLDTKSVALDNHAPRSRALPEFGLFSEFVR